jgi:hypothetical protein
LLCLENQLRRQSDGDIALKNYIEWLIDAGIAVPKRRTLSNDFRRYADYCDDVRHGGRSKVLSLDSTATRDAVAWLMGNAWLDSPLHPRLSSSCVRCLLLAKELQAEVDFPYSQLRKPGEPWVPKTIRGIPLRMIPGIDSSYMQLRLDWGGKCHINLARVQQYVRFTGNSTQNYASLKEEQPAIITIESTDIFLLERLTWQFPKLKIDKEKCCATLQIEKSQALMTRDILKDYLERCQTPDRQISPKQYIGNTVIYYENNRHYTDSDSI